MKDISANGKPLQGVRGFLTVSVIGFVLTLALLVDETESAREAKGTKSVKSNKEKVRKISYISVFVKALVLVKPQVQVAGLDAVILTISRTVY